MAMNREQRRYLQKQGQMDSEGNIIAKRPDRADRSDNERDSIGTYFKGVRSELKKVTWPTRSEVINYTIVVAVIVSFLTIFVAGLDFGFSEAIGSFLDLEF